MLEAVGEDDSHVLSSSRGFLADVLMGCESRRSKLYKVELKTRNNCIMIPLHTAANKTAMNSQPHLGGEQGSDSRDQLCAPTPQARIRSKHRIPIDRQALVARMQQKQMQMKIVETEKLLHPALTRSLEEEMVNVPASLHASSEQYMQDVAGGLMNALQAIERISREGSSNSSICIVKHNRCNNKAESCSNEPVWWARV